jgi:hypothetical protein
MFIPENPVTWRQRIEAIPQNIEEYRSRTNVLYQRLLVDPDAESTASQDMHYTSAFVNMPTKTCCAGSQA